MSPLQLISSPQDLKLAGASMFAVVAAVGEAVGSTAGWESISLKVALIGAVVYLVRELKQQRDKNDAAATKREEILVGALRESQEAAKAQAEALLELKAATDTQTSWFKTVAQTLLSRDINPKLP